MVPRPLHHRCGVERGFRIFGSFYWLRCNAYCICDTPDLPSRTEPRNIYESLQCVMKDKPRDQITLCTCLEHIPLMEHTSIHLSTYHKAYTQIPTPSMFQPQRGKTCRHRADALRHSNGERRAPQKLYACLEAPLPRWLDLSAVTCCRTLPLTRRRTPSGSQVCDFVQTWDHGKSSIRRCYHCWGGRHLAAALASRKVDA